MTPFVEFAEHAVERYQERLRPGLDRDGAAAELRSLAASVGTFATDPPEWVYSGEPTDAWLLLGDSIALPLCLRGGVYTAATCLTTGLTKRERSIRNASRAKAKRHKRQRDEELGRGLPVRDREQWWAAGERPTGKTEGAAT